MMTPIGPPGIAGTPVQRPARAMPTPRPIKHPAAGDTVTFGGAKSRTQRKKSNDTILVTGGAGYIGSHFVKRYLESNPKNRVLVVDNLSVGHPKAIKLPRKLARRLQFVNAAIGDTATLKTLMKRYRVKAVVHFAASASVAESQRDPMKYLQNNVVGTLNLLKAMEEAGVRQLVFSSTAAVYGNPQQVPITEDHPKAPVNVYGHTKLMMEKALELLNQQGKLSYIALRYFNAAGADESGLIGESHAEESHLVPLILQTAAGKRPAVKIFGNNYATPDGTCIRDFIHVTDLADAHIQALQHLEANPGTGRAFNLGTGSGASVQSVIDLCREITGQAIPTETAPRRDGDPAVLVAAPDEARKVLGWQPKYSLKDIITSAWNWEKNRKY